MTIYKKTKYKYDIPQKDKTQGTNCKYDKIQKDKKSKHKCDIIQNRQNANMT